jgi:hypothetical protein
MCPAMDSSHRTQRSEVFWSQTPQAANTFTKPLYLVFMGRWLDLAYGISGLWALGPKTPVSRILWCVFNHEILPIGPCLNLKLKTKNPMCKIKLKLKFWTQGPNSGDSTCQVQLLTPKHQIRRHVEGRERRFITSLGTHHGKKGSNYLAIFRI